MSEAFDPYYTWLGIPPEEQPPDHYRLLGLRTFEPNLDVIANAVDRQMLMLRTFQAGPRSKESQQILNQISTAKVCLLDPTKKSDYDRQLSAAAETANASSPTARPVPKPAARRKAADPSITAPVPQIVVNSDGRPATQRPAPPRLAWQKPAVLGSAIAVVLLLIVISAIMLGISSNDRESPNVPPDAASADSPASLANVEPEKAATPDTPVAGTGQPTNPLQHNPSPPPPIVVPTPADTADANSQSKPDVQAVVQDDAPPPQIGALTENVSANLPVGGDSVEDPDANAAATVSTESVKRLAIPNSEKQKTVLGQVKEIFKDEYQAAPTSEGRTALAEKLIEQSREEGLEAAGRFVLLREAFTYAAEAVQPDLAFEAADQLGRQFDIDSLDLKCKAVSNMDKAAWDVDSRKRVAAAAMAVSRECLLGDRVPTADKLSEIAEDAAARSRDGELRIKARTWHDDVRQFAKQWNVAEEAEKVLATNADDAEANTQLGKFLCLTMNDWEKGLPHLAKTDRANLRQLAELEQAAPQSANDRVQLADAWWEAAKSAVSDEKDAYQRRARHWYQTALADLTGLQKVKVERRLETLADVGEPVLVARNDVAPKLDAPPLQQPRPAGPGAGIVPKSLKIEKRQELSWQDRTHVTIAISPDRRRVAIKPDGWLVCWDIGTGRLLRAIELPRNGFHGPAFSPDGNQVGCPVSGGTFAFFDLRTGGIARKFDQVGSVVTFSNDGRLMATVSRTDPIIKVVDTQNGRMQPLKGYVEAPRSLTFSSDGRKLLSGGFNVPTYLWDVATAKQTLVGNNTPALALSPDGKLFAVAGGGNTIKLGDTATGATVRELNGHERTPNSLNFSPRGQLLGSMDSSSEDSVMKIWNVQTGDCLATVNNPEQMGYVAFAADDIVVTGGHSRKVVLWNLKPNDAAPKPAPQPPIAPRGVARPENEQPGQGDPDRAAARWVLSIKDSGRPFFLTAVSLTMRGTNVYRERIGTLEDLPEEGFDLNAILIRNGDITDHDLRILTGLRQLKSVTLPDTPISDQGLQHLKNCPLNSLTVCGNVTDAGVKLITENFQLGNLQLDNTQITDAGLAHLRKYKQLYTLALRRTKITDAGLAQLTDLQGLAFLWVDDTNITGAGVKHLAQLQSLKTLSLVRTKVNLDALRPLATLPKLEYLWLEGTLSLAEVESIRPLFPNVKFPNLR